MQVFWKTPISSFRLSSKSSGSGSSHGDYCKEDHKSSRQVCRKYSTPVLDGRWKSTLMLSIVRPVHYRQAEKRSTRNLADRKKHPRKKATRKNREEEENKRNSNCSCSSQNCSRSNNSSSNNSRDRSLLTRATTRVANLVVGLQPRSKAEHR